ncbi:hypothetical protein PY257_09035 [Ramlibacter sp. H39-3-26]|uniref:hypothetical protein n=1 Tax=Curvibacter soli TaxID=3031331 RepID=UPI0023DC3904|nr:hypothetical protein [Ramlibacter sp. H39-3-26]MDF1485319.1 hypothetical protein [Ramlibacter sp. H39-3-26]
MAMTSSVSPQRQEALRAMLLDTADLLKKNRASEVSEAAIEDFVALSWLEWNGGALRITTTGRNICNQLVAGMTKQQTGHL